MQSKHSHPHSSSSSNERKGGMDESFEVEERRKMTQALSQAIKATDSELYDLIFDSLLALITAYVPFRKLPRHHAHAEQHVCVAVVDSKLLMASHKDQLAAMIGRDRSWRLLYHATRDGSFRKQFGLLLWARKEQKRKPL